MSVIFIDERVAYWFEKDGSFRRYLEWRYQVGFFNNDEQQLRDMKAHGNKPAFELRLSEEDVACGCPRLINRHVVESFRTAIEEWTGAPFSSSTTRLTPEEFYCIYYGHTNLDHVPSSEELANWLNDLNA